MRRPRGLRHHIALFVLVCLGGMVVPFRGQAASLTAEALFQEGRRLLVSGNTAEACDRLAESNSLEASSGTLLNLALCHEKLGRTAHAYAEYREAARLASRQGRAERVVVAERRREALRPRLARVTIMAPDAPSGLTVTSDDGSLGEDMIGVPVPLDPGVREVTVSAPMHRTWSAKVVLREGEQRVLLVPLLEQESRQPEAAPLRARFDPRPPPLGAPLAPSENSPAPSSRLSLFEISALAGGGALTVAGAVVWTMAYSRWRSAERACNETPGSCPDFDRRVTNIGTLKEIAIGSWAAAGTVVAAAFAYHQIHRPRDSVGVAFDPVSREFSLRAAF